MGLQELRREVQRLRRKLEESPKLLAWRGRRVVPLNSYEYGDFSVFPDGYMPIMDDPPEGYWEDYIALLEELKPEDYGRAKCWDCPIKHFTDLKDETARLDSGWTQEDRKRFYQECGAEKREEFIREDKMRMARARLLNKTGGARNRICRVQMYYRCPYPGEAPHLLEKGTTVEWIWKIVEYYDHHWNPHPGNRPPDSDREFNHQHDRGFLDVTDPKDILKAMKDGRLDKIEKERERYEASIER